MLKPGPPTTDVGRTAVIEQRGTRMDDRAQTRPHRREAILACALGVALFVIPLAIDLARAAA